MRILRMTASFGSLQKKELTLHEGLNVFCLPNESGKSTWSAFVLCMLYGLDTAERASKTNLPAKTRYKPWWGGNMEGRMELEWNGRRIAIERTSTARASMGQFRAWDLDSGEAVPELTADNCGQTLLGVERSVFLRSAFLGQRALGVTADAALEKRLARLVTSGEESVSAAETQKRLKDARNRIQHNRAGLLPQAEAELSAVQERLSAMEAICAADFDARAQEQALTKQEQTLEQELDGAERFQTAKRFAKKKEAEAFFEQKTQQANAARQEAERYPAPEKLQALRLSLETLESRRAALPQVPENWPAAPEKPACPQAFAGLREDEILPKAEQDAKRCQTLLSGKKAPTTAACILGGALALAAALLLAVKSMTLAILCAALALGCFAAGIVGTRKNRALEENRHEAALICAQYERCTPEQFVSFAAGYHASLLLYEQAYAAYERACREFDDARAAHARQENELSELRGKILGTIGAFAEEAADEASAKAAISRAEQAWAACNAAEAAQQNAKDALDAVAAALAGVPEPEVPEGDWAQLDPAQLRRELSALRQSRTMLRSRLDQNRGRLEALGDGAALEARREELEARVAALREKDEALALASASLEDAAQALQTRFAPKLTALAGSIFARLTGARYDTVTLDRQMNVSAGEAGEVAQRPALALSGGTADQLYLALRLAICELALPQDTPVILDDALAMFDDARAKQALAVLRELAKTRQILLFSCHSREQAFLEAE